MEIPYVKTVSALVATATLFGAIYQGFQMLDERHALRSELDASNAARVELSRTLQLRDNMNFLEGNKNILEYDVKRITSVLQMYQTRELLNGELDAADRNRVITLQSELAEAQKNLDGVKEAINNIRLSIEPH